MAKLRQLLFDLGNVLFELDEEATVRDLKALIKDDVSTAEMHTAVASYDTGEWSTERFINFFLRRAKAGVQARDVVVSWNKMMLGMRPEVLNWLEWLSGDYELYLLSNNNALHYGWFVDHLKKVHGLENFNERYFVRTYYSHLIGRRKPDPEVYEWVLQDAGLEPDSMLFFDDRPENIEGARALGIPSVHVPHSSQLKQVLDETLPGWDRR